MHASFEQRGLFDLRFVVVGVLVPDVVADDPTVVLTVASEVSGSWLFRGDGVKRFRVDFSSSSRSPTVVAGSNCLPPKTKVEPAGNVVGTERNCRTLDIVCVGLTLSWMAIEKISSWFTHWYMS